MPQGEALVTSSQLSCRIDRLLSYANEVHDDWELTIINDGVTRESNMVDVSLGAQIMWVSAAL